MTGVYRIAGRVIGVYSIYDKVHEYCRDYRCDEAPEFTVTVTAEDIEYERARSEHAAEAEHRRSRSYEDCYLEELAVYRKISEKMPEYDTFLFHGSCIAVDGEGYLFTASSGTGKSTHTRLWREYFGSRAVMVNDDKPLIRADSEGVTVFGTPYNGKHRLGENIAVPLKAVCLLERAEKNTIRPVTKEEAYPFLLRQVYRPSDPLMMQKTLILLDRLTESVRLCRLGCNQEPEAAKVAYSGMNKDVL